MTLIAVSGSAEHRHAPERGTVWVTAEFTGAAREGVVASTAALHKALVHEVKLLVHDGRATWWTSQQVAAGSYREYVKDHDETVLRHRASARLSAKFRDFAALGAWLGQVGERDGATVSGIEWTLTDETRLAAEHEVRQAALQDAVARAKSYAQALGSHAEPRLVALYEPGLRPGVAPESPMGSIGMLRAASGGASPEFELHPDDLVVQAEVSADFELDR